MQNNGESPKLPHLVGKELTNRERECLRLVAPQFGSKEIARALGISPNTVDARIKSACAKLGTNSRFVAAQLISEQVTVTRKDTNLVSEPRGLPQPLNDGMMEASAGVGDSSDEIAPEQSLKSESQDSGLDVDRREIHHLIANFGGLQKDFSTFRHWIHIIAIGLASALALGAIINSLAELSKILPLP